MTEREQAVFDFALAKGIDLSLDCDALLFQTGMVIVPSPDAPLHEHGAFVFRIAEAVGATQISTIWVSFIKTVDFDGHTSCADDLSHAALLAGTAALKARKR